MISNVRYLHGVPGCFLFLEFHHHYFLFLTVVLFLPFPIRSYLEKNGRSSFKSLHIAFGLDVLLNAFGQAGSAPV